MSDRTEGAAVPFRKQRALFSADVFPSQDFRIRLSYEGRVSGVSQAWFEMTNGSGGVVRLGFTEPGEKVCLPPCLDRHQLV